MTSKPRLTAFRSSLRRAISISFSSLLIDARLTGGVAGFSGALMAGDCDRGVSVDGETVVTTGEGMLALGAAIGFGLGVATGFVILTAGIATSGSSGTSISPHPSLSLIKASSHNQNLDQYDWKDRSCVFS